MTTPDTGGRATRCDERRRGVLWAYAAATSGVVGERLRFRIGGSVPRGFVTVHDEVSGAVVLETPVHGPEWVLDIPDTWRSSLYRAVFTPGDAEVWFVVRPAPRRR